VTERLVPPYRIGVDIGGTFTDIVAIDSAGNIATKKVPSTPDDYGRAIVESIGQLIAQLDLDPASVREVIHGTTVATNTILERKGAETGLLTTRGFRDALEIGRLRYPRMYDLTWSKPPPLIERRRRIEIIERLDRFGAVVTSFDAEAARAAVASLIADGIQSVAVCFLHSHVNPAHEELVRSIVEELAPDLPISLSSEVLPEIGEYERTSTTVINAYLQPVVSRYLASLAGGLARVGVAAPVSIMQSNGGIMSARAASERPIHIVESGPAAGVIAARNLARQIDRPNLITLDMGGTTAKASIVEGGQLHQATECEVGAGINVGNRLNRGAGYLLRVPAVDIAEVGAGGGSIVWLDPAGSLHVGPHSAGAVPGPVCYAAGGTLPTLTDANVLLGYLNQSTLLGGALPIDRELARAAFDAQIARPLGLSTLEAAHGVHRIGVASMVRVVRSVSSERGRDPRGFTLVAFGGNGPVHAALVAAELGIPTVIVPPRPGLFSAVGLLVAEPSHHFSRTILRQTRSLGPGDLAQAFRAVEATALATLRRDGRDVERIVLTRQVDLRYVGQSFELRLPVDDADLTGATPAELDRRFGDEHERTYGHRAEGEPVEIVHLRVTATAREASTGDLFEQATRPPDAPPTYHRKRAAYFGRGIGTVEVPVLAREEIGSAKVAGPIIIEEYDATTVVPPGSQVWRDLANDLVIEIGELP
jgi:N-methylhydantoinase A